MEEKEEVGIEFLEFQRVNADIQIQLILNGVNITSTVRKISSPELWPSKFNFQIPNNASLDLTIVIFQPRTFMWSYELGRVTLPIFVKHPEPHTYSHREFWIESQPEGYKIKLLATYGSEKYKNIIEHKYDHLLDEEHSIHSDNLYQNMNENLPNIINDSNCDDHSTTHKNYDDKNDDKNDSDDEIMVEDITSILSFSSDPAHPVPIFRPPVEEILESNENEELVEEEILTEIPAWTSGQLDKSVRRSQFIGNIAPLTPEEEEERKQSARRSHIVKEIYDTETTYIEFLKTVIDTFLTTLPKVIKDKSVLSEYTSVLFQNVTDIQLLHWEHIYIHMLERINDYAPEKEWVDIFVSAFAQEEFKDIYQIYINGYDRAAQLATNAKKAFSSKSLLSSGPLEVLGEHIEKKLSLTTHNFASITSYLIAPVQRLPRYILFFRDLLKCTPNEHPDYANIVEAHNNLNQIITEINLAKGTYDKVYRIEEIYRMFAEDDRAEIACITEPVRELLLEGEMVEGKKNAKIRYILLFSDLCICSTKTIDDSLKFEWKVDLCNSGIEFLVTETDGESSEYLKLTSQKKITNYPYTLEVVHELFASPESNQTMSLWKDKFEVAQQATKNILFVHETTKFVTTDMQNQLLFEVRDDLFETWVEQKFSKSEVLRRIGRKTKNLMLIKEGTCLIQMKIGDEVKNIGEISAGQFIGEMSYLSDNYNNELSSAIVTPSSDQVVVLKTSYKKLDKFLSSNPVVASKFFLLLCILMAQRLIKEQSETSDWKSNINNNNNNTIINNLSNLSSHPSNANISQIPTLLSASSASLTLPSPLSPSTPSLSTILPSDEIIISQFQCTMKPHSTAGILVISKSSINYEAANFFGISRKLTTYPFSHISRIEEPEENSNILKIYYMREKKRVRKYKSVEFIMKNSSELHRAILYITPYINQTKRRSTSVKRTKKERKDVKSLRSTDRFDQIEIERGRERGRSVERGKEKDRRERSIERDRSIERGRERERSVDRVRVKRNTKNRDDDDDDENNKQFTAESEDENDSRDYHSDTGDDPLISSKRNKSPPPKPVRESYFTLKKKDWKLLHDTAQPLKFKEGETIIEQGSIPTSLFQLVEGTCHAELLLSQGSTLNVGSIKSGEIFGEMSFIIGVVSSASVVTDSPCTVMALNRSKLELLLFNEPRIAAALYRFIAKLLRNRVLENQLAREQKQHFIFGSKTEDSESNDQVSVDKDNTQEKDAHV